MTELKPEAKEEIKRAYESFEAALRTIAHEHRLTVSELLAQLDQKHIEAIEARLHSSDTSK